MNQAPKLTENKVTCLYCRVSTRDQKFGLESQIRTLKEFCQKADSQTMNSFPTKELAVQSQIARAWIE